MQFLHSHDAISVACYKLLLQIASCKLALNLIFSPCITCVQCMRGGGGGGRVQCNGFSFSQHIISALELFNALGDIISALGGCSGDIMICVGALGKGRELISALEGNIISVLGDIIVIVKHRHCTNVFVKFLQGKWRKYHKRRAKISADISARLLWLRITKSQVY